MFLHIYTERELRQDLQSAGLKTERMVRLNITSSGLLSANGFASSLRAGGYIAVGMRNEHSVAKKTEERIPV